MNITGSCKAHAALWLCSVAACQEATGRATGRRLQNGMASRAGADAAWRQQNDGSCRKPSRSCQATSQSPDSFALRTLAWAATAARRAARRAALPLTFTPAKLLAAEVWAAARTARRGATCRRD